MEEPRAAKDTPGMPYQVASRFILTLMSEGIYIPSRGDPIKMLDCNEILDARANCGRDSDSSQISFHFRESQERYGVMGYRADP